MKLRTVLFILLFLNPSVATFFVGGHPLPEQQKPGRVSGVVFNDGDGGVAGAKITFMRDPNMQEFFTNDAGEFDVQLPAGAYRFTISADGFCNFQREKLIVTAGKTELINIHLEAGVNDVPNLCKCTTRRRQQSGSRKR